MFVSLRTCISSAPSPKNGRREPRPLPRRCRPALAPLPPAAPLPAPGGVKPGRAPRILSVPARPRGSRTRCPRGLSRCSDVSPRCSLTLFLSHLCPLCSQLCPFLSPPLPPSVFQPVCSPPSLSHPSTPPLISGIFGFFPFLNVCS